MGIESTSIAGKYNHGIRFNFQIPKDFAYHSLANMFENDGKGIVYPVKGLYINHKSKFGDAPVIVSDFGMVNLPKHLTDTCKQMLLDDEFIEAVNANKVGFTIYAYTTKNSNEIRYSVTWIDL